MLMRSHNKTKQQGFTLLEALISVAVLSFGMLAIGSFQAKLVSESAHNKARGEAIALAQAKMDDLRSYSTEHEMVEKLIDTTRAAPDPSLNCQVANAEYCYPVDVPTASTSYSDAPDGVNASFTREWDISRAVTSDATDNDSLMSNIVVSVSWTDRKGEKQSVSLESDLTFRNPRGAADVQEVSEPLVDSPTGNAYLGDGSLTEGEMNDVKANPDTFDYTDNNDGTATADHDGDGDLELIVEKDDGSAEVVLTLPKACKLEDDLGNPICNGFVEISGTVFINENDSGGSTNLSITGLNADDVWVIASDAAYCSRWIPTNDPQGAGTLSTSNDLTETSPLSPYRLSGGRMYLNNDTTVDFTGAGYGNYSFFNYTCYLGGGWYGNIGLIMLGENSQDYVCVGDPDADAANPGDKWRRVEVAKRRVYRGMLHKYLVDGNGDAILDGFGNHQEVKVDQNDATSETIFYSQGIRDEAIFPNANWAVRNYGHDYVIGKSNTQDVDNCKLLMGLPDANPDAATELATSVTTPNLFYNRTGDFVCLNEDYEDAPSGALEKFLGSPWHYLSVFDTGEYDARVDCPYDPSVPPSVKYVFSGTLNMESLHDSWGSTDPASGLFEGNINTSDGYANCLITSATASQVAYTCEYYVWADINGIEYPWSGSAFVSTPSDVVCRPDTDPDVTENYVHEAVYAISSITGNTNTNINFTCKDMVDYSVQGTISSANNDLNTVGGNIKAYAEDGTEITGACSTFNMAADGSSLDYSCDNLLEASYLGGFTGDIKATWSNTDFSCNGISTNDAQSTLCTEATAFVPGEAVWHFENYIDATAPAESIGNDLNLRGPLVYYTVTGTVIDGMGASDKFQVDWFNGNVAPGFTVSLDYDGATYPVGSQCNWTVPATAATAVDYSCSITGDTSLAPTWTGNVVIKPHDGWWCGSGSAISTTALTMPAASVSDVTCVRDTSAPVTITGSVYAGFPSDTTYLNFIGSSDLRTDTVTTFSAWLEDGTGAVDGTCTFTTEPTLLDALVKQHFYTCTSNDVAHNSTWSGSVNFKTNGTAWAKFCYPKTGAATASYAVAGPLPPGDSSTVLEYIVVTDENDVLGFVKCPDTP